MRKLTLLTFSVLLAFSSLVSAGPDDCSDVERWDENTQTCKARVTAMGVRG